MSAASKQTDTLPPLPIGIDREVSLSLPHYNVIGKVILLAMVMEGGRCAPGNECRLTVENATEIRSLKDDLTEVKADVKEIKKLIDKLVYGVAGSVILLLLNWIWQLAQKG